MKYEGDERTTGRRRETSAAFILFFSFTQEKRDAGVSVYNETGMPSSVWHRIDWSQEYIFLCLCIVCWKMMPDNTCNAIMWISGFFIITKWTADFTRKIIFHSRIRTILKNAYKKFWFFIRLWKSIFSHC